MLCHGKHSEFKSNAHEFVAFGPGCTFWKISQHLGLLRPEGLKRQVPETCRTEVVFPVWFLAVIEVAIGQTKERCEMGSQAVLTVVIARSRIDAH